MCNFFGNNNSWLIVIIILILLTENNNGCGCERNNCCQRKDYDCGCC